MEKRAVTQEPMLPAAKNLIPTPYMRMLRCCAALCLTMLALPAASANCSITRMTGNDAVHQVFKENNGYEFQNYDVICNKLRKANAKIVIQGSYGVLRSRSYGWVSIGVADKNSDYIIINAFGRTSTYMDDYPSDEVARKQLWTAINEALNGWDQLDLALDSLNKARQAVRKTAAQR